MKKTKIRIFAALLMTVLCMTAFSTTAFAGGGEGTTEPTPEVTEPAEPQPKKGKGNPMGIVALLIVFGLIGGGAFYYFKAVKNKEKPQSNPNMNEYDYSDEDEDEDEYEPTSEEQDDTPEESEDDTQ